MKVEPLDLAVLDSARVGLRASADRGSGINSNALRSAMPRVFWSASGDDTEERITVRVKQMASIAARDATGASMVRLLVTCWKSA